MKELKAKYTEILKETEMRIKAAKTEEEREFYLALAGKLLADAKQLGIEIKKAW